LSWFQSLQDKNVAIMKKTHDDKLQFVVLGLQARIKNKKKNTYLQSEGSI
jgi:hypothetical protein